MKKIKVQISFTWEFSPKDWREMLKFEEARADIVSKVDEDALSTFFYLNDITYPEAKLKVSEIDV